MGANASSAAAFDDDASPLHGLVDEGSASPHEPRDLGADLGIEDFTLLKKVGQGAFAAVWMAKKRRDGALVAVKIQEKAHIMKAGRVESVVAERDILATLRHPFIVQLLYAFQNYENIYLVLTWVDGKLHGTRRSSVRFDSTRLSILDSTRPSTRRLAITRAAHVSGGWPRRRLASPNRAPAATHAPRHQPTTRGATSSPDTSVVVIESNVDNSNSNPMMMTVTTHQGATSSCSWTSSRAPSPRRSPSSIAVRRGGGDARGGSGTEGGQIEGWTSLCT